MTSRLLASAGLVVVLLSACGENGATDEIVSGVPIGSADTIAAPDAVPDRSAGAPADSTPVDPPPVATADVGATSPDGLRPVETFEEISGIWMPVEVNGQPVDAAALGAYLQLSGLGTSARAVGYDGCNRIGGRPTGSGPLLDRGRLGSFETDSTAMDCDESIRVDFGTDALLSVSDDRTELFADGLAVVGSIRYQRVESVPMDPRIAIREAEQAAEEDARIAEEEADAAAIDRSEAEAREQIRSELPDARARWAESGVQSYTLRFENASLMNDPSFPVGRPVGGVWEIDVVDGVALDNEWSDSILGDTVEDWFAYVEAQLDSHYLRVTFDPELGHPTLIDSQPLDDMTVEDPDSITAWLVFGEVVV